MVGNEKITVDPRNGLVYLLDTMTGQKLKRARTVLAMTQKELGEALDLAKNTVARAERGEIPIHRTTELAIRFLLLMRKRRGGKSRR